MNTKKISYLAILLCVVAMFISSDFVMAQQPQSQNMPSLSRVVDKEIVKMRPDVIGKVTAVSGNTITVESKNKNSTTTTYTVDATNAKLVRGGNTITISDIAVNDNVLIQGTITGTSVVATLIRDGKIGNGKNEQEDNNGALAKIQGNGQPVMAGTVSAVSGSTITVINSNVTYTVDATSAKIYQGKNTITVSELKVNDEVIVQGTFNGTSVTASMIIDQVKSTDNATTDDQGDKKTKKGFFKSIGSFFKRLFGF